LKRQLILQIIIILVVFTVVLSVPIKIRTIPGAVSVYINNTLFGITDRSGILSEMLFLVEGEYLFKAEKPGYNTLEKSIAITEATSICLEMIPSGVLSVQVFPEDGRILVDEKMESIGKFEEELPVGKHYVEITRENYITRTFYLEVKQYSKRELQVVLEKEGKTRILSHPSGALVSIDGNKIGETPLELYIDEGKHLISFHKDWYYSKTSDINIKKEGLNEITEILNPYSNLTIKASPSHTSITVNNKKATSNPLILKEIPPGKYQLVMSAQGYQPLEKEIVIEIGENQLFEELPLKEYQWTFSSTPAAILTIDGNEIGITPVELAISHGEHMVYLSSGEKEWMSQINVEREGQTAVNLNHDTTILFDIIPAGQSFVLHNGVEYESPAIINTTNGMQTFDIVRGGYPTRRRLFKLLPGKIYEQVINLEGESELFLVTKPGGAAVYWMGSYIGDTPLRGLKIRPGSGMLKMQWSDGTHYEENFTFLDGETYTLYREIPSYTKLTINSLPDRLEIYLDGKPSGITPLTLNLKQGTYIIKCLNQAGQQQEKIITLNGESERTINFIF